MSRKWFPGLTPSRPAPVDLDTGVPHPARIYDYILGGKDNFAADQAAARAAMAADPYLVTAMRENRAAMRRAALMLFGILHFLQDSDDPYGVVASLVDALAPGSYLAIQHATADFYPPGGGTAGAYNRAGIPFQYRTRDEFERFLAGLHLVPPGIVPMAEWRADGEPQPRPSPLEAGGYVAVARKD